MVLEQTKIRKNKALNKDSLVSVNINFYPSLDRSKFQRPYTILKEQWESTKTRK